MKKIIYTLLTVVLITSCRSIDKMVESGNYDQALKFGVDKLRGQKNKKTKFVKGLEKAYAKLNEQDLNRINHLKLNGKRNSYDRIVDIYTTMENRQQYVMPLLPLISEDGYLADINVTDYTGLIHEASKIASQKHYDVAMELLESARTTGDKVDARSAYDQFEEAQFYFDDYKDTRVLKREAYDLGQSRILIEPYTGGSNFAFDHTLDIISNINVARLNNKWEKFYTQDNGTIPFSYIATIEVTDILPGVERERYNTFTETKSVVDGQVALTDRGGNVVKDTSGNIIYVNKLIDVTAQIEELQREKFAEMSGRLVVINALDNTLVNNVPINVTHEFSDYACTFRGDKRALSDVTFKRIKNNCSPFPTDYEITTTMAYTYKDAAEETLNIQYFIN